MGNKLNKLHKKDKKKGKNGKKVNINEVIKEVKIEQPKVEPATSLCSQKRPVMVILGVDSPPFPPPAYESHDFNKTESKVSISVQDANNELNNEVKQTEEYQEAFNTRDTVDTIEINELDDEPCIPENSDDKENPTLENKNSNSLTNLNELDNNSVTTNKLDNLKASTQYSVSDNSSLESEPSENTTKSLPSEFKQKIFIVSSYNDFAFNLFKNVCIDKRKNIIMSPYNIAQGVSLLIYGAKYETEKQLCDLLKCTRYGKNQIQDDNGVLKKHFKNTLTGRFVSLNRVYTPLDIDIDEEYKKLLQKSKSEIIQLDFSNGAECVAKINEWITAETTEKIKILFNNEDLNKLTSLVLVNAIYFFGKWKIPFLTHKTQRKEFFCSDNTVKQVYMMHHYKLMLKYLKHFKPLNVSACLLPYADYKFSMLVLLPNHGVPISDVISKLDAYLIKRIYQEVRYERLNFAMPKFKLNNRFELSKAFAQLGGVDLSNETKANFSSILAENCKDERLYLSKIVHKAIFRINENGILEPDDDKIKIDSKVSNKSLSIASENNTKIENFICNRPFIFIVKDHKTQTIVFLGKYNEP